MIYIFYNGTKILANNDGVPVNIPEYWKPPSTILEEITQAFAAGEWEPIPDPEPPPPEPDWEGFMGPFYTPAGAGNGSPHDVLETKVQRCFLVASRIADQTERETAQAAALSLQRHWSNCIIGLTNKEIRSSSGWLLQTWNSLKGFFTVAVSLLPIDQQDICNLTPEETTFIESLFAQYNLL